MRPTWWIVLSFVGCLSVGHASANAEKFEGNIQAMDAGGFSITIKTASESRKLDVLKKVKVTVNGKAGSFADVRRGQQVKVEYNSELEVVTRIDAVGEGAAEPELVPLNELPNSTRPRGSPWLSDDGLTLYWKGVPPDDAHGWVFSASRKSPNHLFEEAQRVVPGNDPTVTSDGLELIVLGKENLLVSRRSSLKDVFGRPQRITELQSHGFLAAPCISGDGLRLYADLLDFKNRTVKLVVSTRSSRRDKWSAPQPLEFQGMDDPRQRFVHVTPDGRYALASLQETKGDWEASQIVLWQADQEPNTFHSPKLVEVSGELVRGKFPRYIAASQELFFVRRMNGTIVDEIVVLRGFDPELHTRALSAEEVEKQANSAAKQQVIQQLQGEWLTTHEETNGRTTPAAESRQVNRRIVIQGHSLVMSRTQGGMLGKYNGEFDVDAQSGHFDWRGKGPRGADVELRGSFELNGDRLKLCYNYVKDNNTPRPTDFRTKADGSGVTSVSLVLKREITEE